MSIELVESVARSSKVNRRPSSVDFKSRYIPSSYVPSTNPEVFKSFFKQHPMEKYKMDVSKYRAVSYDAPDPQFINNRKFMVVEQNVVYGKPISHDQFRRLSTQKKPEHEVITYGTGSAVKKVFSVPPREKIEITKDSAKAGCGGCCGFGDKEDTSKYVVQNYK